MQIKQNGVRWKIQTKQNKKRQFHKKLHYFTDRPNIYNKKKIVLTTKPLGSRENIGVWRILHRTLETFTFLKFIKHSWRHNGMKLSGTTKVAHRVGTERRALRVELVFESVSSNSSDSGSGANSTAVLVRNWLLNTPELSWGQVDRCGFY